MRAWIGPVRAGADLLAGPGALPYTDTPGSPMRAIDAIATLEASAGPEDGGAVYVEEVAATYLWEAGSTATINHTTVLGHTSGAAGRWTLLGGSVSLSALPNQADNGPRVQSFCTAGALVELAAGDVFAWATPLRFANNLPILLLGALSGGAIHSTIVVADQPDPNFASVFNADAEQADDRLSGTLASDVTLGATTIHVTGMARAPAVGAWLSVRHATSEEVYQVIAVAAAGPTAWTVTVFLGGDGKCVGLPFVAGDEVAEWKSRPTLLTLDGRGMSILGDGNQAMELSHTERTTVTNWTITPTNTGVGFDIGGDANVASRLALTIATSGPTDKTGLYMQSQRGTVFRECTVSGGAEGIETLDCLQCEVVECWVTGSAEGIVAGSLPLGAQSSLGNFGCATRGGGAIGCATGHNVFGSADYSISEWSAYGCSQYGIILQNVVNTPTTQSTTITSCTTNNCAGDATPGFGVGVYVGLGVLGTTIRDHTANDCRWAAILAVGDVDVDGLYATSSSGYASGAAVILTSARATITHAAISLPGADAGVQCSGTLATVLDSTVLGAAVGYYVTAGTLHVSGCTATGAVGLAVQLGTAHIGPGCAFDACATPVLLAPGATATMDQTGGVASFAGAASTSTMTFAQHYATRIEIGNGSPINAGTQTIQPLASFIGQSFVVRNYNTAGSTTIVFGVTIPPLTTYLLQCSAAGTWERVVL